MKVSKFEEILVDHYYLYPSHADSAALIFSGCNILTLRQDKEFAMYAAMDAAFIAGLVLQKHRPDYVEKILSEGVWDLPEESVDQALLEAAQKEFGDRFHEIEYGSEVHNLLNELIVQD